MVGRILEDETDPGATSMGKTLNVSYPKFLTFFKKVTIYLDQGLYPDNHAIVWDNSRSHAPQDGFEVKRKGGKEFSAMIKLELNYIPENFNFNPVHQRSWYRPFGTMLRLENYKFQLSLLFNV